MEGTGRMAGLRTPTEREFTMTHVFNASREEVFSKTIDPKLIPLWWGPREMTTRVDKMEVRPGREWRFVQHDTQGNEYAFHGVYQEITPPSRLVYTFIYEAQPEDVMVETVVFEDVDGKTRVTVTDLFPNEQSRDAAMKMGMEKGAQESMERFAEVLGESH